MTNIFAYEPGLTVSEIKALADRLASEQGGELTSRQTHHMGMLLLDGSQMGELVAHLRRYRVTGPEYF